MLPLNESKLTTEGCNREYRMMKSRELLCRFMLAVIFDVEFL